MFLLSAQALPKISTHIHSWSSMQPTVLSPMSRNHAELCCSLYLFYTFPIRKFFKRQRIDSRRDSPWGKKMRTDLLGPKVYLSRNSSGLWVEEEVNTWERTQRWGGRTVCLPLIQLTKGRGFHRIREQSGSEGTFKGHLVHLPSWRTQQAYCS